MKRVATCWKPAADNLIVGLLLENLRFLTLGGSQIVPSWRISYSLLSLWSHNHPTGTVLMESVGGIPMLNPKKAEYPIIQADPV